MIFVLAGLFGLVIGSFLNVCIVRLPKEQSLAMPPSHCPRCNAPIRAYDNIPVISFLLLRGRCRSCKEPISWRYPLVELANGALYVLTLFLFGPTAEALVSMALCSSLLVITVIDLDHQIIPDVISLPGIVIGLAVAPLVMYPLADPLPFRLGSLLPAANPYLTALANSLLGLLAGGGPLFLLGWTWEKLRKVEAMGGGDVKLMAMVGTFLGWKGALLTNMLGALTGSVIGIALIALKRHEMGKVIPFGPFLAFGAVVSLFFGPDIIAWYLGLTRL